MFKILNSIVKLVGKKYNMKLKSLKCYDQFLFV